MCDVKLVSFHEKEGDALWRVGALAGDGLVDLTAVGLPGDMVDMVALGEEGLRRAREAIASGPVLVLSGVTLGPPIPRLRRNIMCVGKNYHRHAEEFARSGFDATNAGAIPSAPIIFSKSEGAVSASGDAIPASLDPTASTDYEGELAVVIGRGGRGISRDEALTHVYGYTIVNDVTARELQKIHAQWFIGKNIDGFCPMGPALVTADAFAPAAEIGLRTFVNEDLRQSARLGELIFDIPFLIETLSATMTLVPGDVIATGTPDGVGIGFSPPKYLRPGDVVRVEIDGLGALVNPVA